MNRRILEQAGIDPGDALLGGADIADALGIDLPKLWRWRAEDRYGLADIVVPGAPGGPVVASRSRVQAVRDLMERDQGKRPKPRKARKPRPSYTTMPFAGVRALILAAFAEYPSPATAAEVAECVSNNLGIGMLEAPKVVYSELGRLARQGVLKRALVDRRGSTGPRQVWQYRVGDPEIFDLAIARGGRSQSAAIAKQELLRLRERPER